MKWSTKAMDKQVRTLPTGTLMKRFLPYFAKHKKTVIFDLLCASLTTLCELVLPMIVSEITHRGETNPASLTWQFVLMMGGMYLLLRVIDAAANYFMQSVGHIMGSKMETDMRGDLFHHLQKLSFGYYTDAKVGQIMARITSDLFQVTEFAHHCPEEFLIAGVKIIVSFIVLCTKNVGLTLLMFAVLPFMLMFAKHFNSKMRRIFKERNKQVGEINAQVEDSLLGIRVVKSFVREDYEGEKFKKRNDALRAIAEKAFGLVTINMPIMMLITYSTIIAVMWLGAPMVQTGEMEVGLLSSFIPYITQILSSLMMVSMMMMMSTRAVACAKRIIEVLDEKPDITNTAADSSLTVADGSIDFDHVWFKYNAEGSEWNLEDIDLHIKSGSTVGIIGATGSAKSTLVQLIPRLYEVQEGAVRVGGRPVAEYTMEHLRDACAMVLQKNTLFSGSIRSNLLWGDLSATDEEIEAACEAACASEFIHRMPEGYETDLGQGGVNVSGGQKQRLCIARAILKKPKVLILDDSTSAVDTATDAKIRAALRDLLPGTTKIIIAQRIISVMDADMIVVMDDGRTSAIGTHAELMEKSEIYRDVYESQQEGVSENG